MHGHDKPLRADRRARRARRLSVLAACGGIAGPVLFTAAWVVSSLRQAGHPAARIQLSGLAAQDARDPLIMMAAFAVLGACLIGFGAALRPAAVRSAGPWLVIAAGVAAVAAGVFRRDHLLLIGPGFAGESWHNQVHDVVSGIAYAAMLTAPLALARRFRSDPDWAVIARPLQALTLGSAAAMAAFASRALEPWNGVLQRAAVTLAMTAEVLAAVRMLTLPPTGRGDTPARSRSQRRLAAVTQPGADDDRDTDLPGQPGQPGEGLREVLAVALRKALGARDRAATAALRSVLAAISNAEAVGRDAVSAVGPNSPHVAGASAGLGSSEVPRRVVSAAASRAILSAEITERRRAARHYAAAGHGTRAERLTAEADVLQSILAAASAGG